MQINSVEEFDNLPATDTPLASAPATASAPAPKADAAPKTSTIKIQDHPEKETPKDDHIPSALRQAGEGAAAKAKDTPSSTSKPSTLAAAEPQIPTGTDAQQNPDPEPKEGNGELSVRRKSVAPEIAHSGTRRPPLVPEFAAVSSANFRADNAEALGLINHHRNSNIASESKEEAENLAKDLRKSISISAAAQNDALSSLREQKASLAGEATVEDALEG